MDSLYRDVLLKDRQQASLQDSQRETSGVPHLPTHRTVSDQLQDSQGDNNHSKEDLHSEPPGEKSTLPVQPVSSSDTSEQQPAQDRPCKPPASAPTKIHLSQPISSLCGTVTTRSGGPLTVRGEIERISDEEILKNRESEEGIRSIQRFRNYQPGQPSKVSAAACTSHCVWYCQSTHPKPSQVGLGWVILDAALSSLITLITLLLGQIPCTTWRCVLGYCPGQRQMMIPLSQTRRDGLSLQNAMVAMQVQCALNVE